VNPELEQALRDVLAREPRVQWAYLFGSAARGERHRDVDVAVMKRPGDRLRLT
jgi:predicted nucleotidyltransferase